MNRTNLIIGLLILAVLGGCFWFFIERDKNNGKVLGSSINSFYAGKVSTFLPPPRKKDGVDDLKIAADSAILIHEQSKYPLFQKNSSYEVPIASITKVMTATVALEEYKLTDIVEVKKENTDVTPSVMGLVPGERITVENLLYGLLMNSGNDAALALSTGKNSQENFIQKMNDKAKELGLTNTRFKDPAGLDDKARSTAMDVAILFSNALRQEEFKKIITTPETEVESVDKEITHTLKNSNRLTTGEIPLDGVIGGKTGYTPDAGHTLVCAATRQGQTLISVVLKTSSNTPTASAEVTKKLLVWGFDSFNF